MARLVGTFAGVAIFIACIGLFGLASYRTERRTKEIGIRRAVGAERWQIVRLVSGEFLSLVLVAGAIAWPVSHTLSDAWLREFAYRIDPVPWLFPAVGAGALLLGLVTVTYHSLRAASTDPAQTLGDE